MVEVAARHAELVAELTEWAEDLWQAHTGSRVVLVKVPSGWGRSTVLDRFQAEIAGWQDEVPLTLSIRLDSRDLPGDPALQAQVLRAYLVEAIRRSAAEEEQEAHGRPSPAREHGRAAQVVQLLGLDEPGGQVQLGLGIGGLFFSGLTAGISFLLAGVAAGTAQKTWDASPAGQDGALARAARAVAAVSADWPVVAIIDDADRLDADLAVTLVENLTARHDSQVLIVAAVDPGGTLARALTTRVRQGVTSRLIQVAEANPDMGYQSRLELSRRLCPGLPDAGARRIAQRTSTFAEVFVVVAAPALAEGSSGGDEGGVLALVDKAVDVRLARPTPSAEAAVVAWAGGLVHARQADRALEILDATRMEGDPDVRRWESIERLAGPATPRLAGSVETELTARRRQDVAAAILEEALAITGDPEADLASRVAALRAAHHVRADLAVRGALGRAQRELVATLEALGDAAAALQVATEARAEWPAGENFRGAWDWMLAVQIRLANVAAEAEADPGSLVQQLIAEATEGGAVPGLESQVWAAIVLLAAGRRGAAQALASEAAAGLEARTDLGSAGDRWRLLLAFHAGRADLPDLTARLLAPLTTSDDRARQDSAAVVQYAVDGPGADIRLQTILLEAELAALRPGAEDDRLRIHHALAANYGTLGGYHQALAHARLEVIVGTHIQGPRHPATLDARARIARWTGECGNAAEAQALFRGLLPDREEVLGPRNPDTLTTRASMARWTGESGNPAAALRLFRELLLDLKQVLGSCHPDTLAARAGIVRWTGESGNPAAAVALGRELLPDLKQVLGSCHPDTLATRANIALWAGDCGDAAEALRLYGELLPDLEEVLGPRHPATLITRVGIAHWIGKSGDAVGALSGLRELLIDQVEVLGSRHPDTLATRAGIARWTGESGDASAALAFFRELLPDREEILGPHHPDTLTTRVGVARWTGEAGDASAALRLLQELLPDIEEVLGPRHPDTLTARTEIARLMRDGPAAAGG